ncbi:hypothetical protein GCK72_003766 [Caenorhabditis remanei]|uniref:Uncharacterized protein n=1 Tax=Caenorhabditis remanei TaxID=31234 RepID=A0A6A5H7L6_CAERE|nr:hypothetical protein GCK72_003766 [Caenorhabditis remanei]KAF1763820.1 hypothetical protein GCK72_003766 [Caenorhabditis remanei]
MSLPIADLKRKAIPGEVDCYRDSFNSKSSESKQKTIDDNKEVCKEWAGTDSYSDKDSFGYGVCCDIFDLCGGMSGWVILLIILIILLCLAGAAAAFYFFYYKRKMSGTDQEEIESADTVNSKHDISVETY